MRKMGGRWDGDTVQYSNSEKLKEGGILVK